MRAWLAVVALVAGCKGERLKWNDQQIVAFDAGPFHFALPPGWRDLSESQDPELAHLASRLGDAHILVRERDTNTDTNISIMWSGLTGRPTCEQFVAAMQLQAESPKIDRVTTETYGGDPGCTYHFTDGDAEARTILRMHGNQFLTIQCMHTKRGDAKADATCDSLIAALQTQ